MSHIKITSRDSGGHTLIVDDVDMSMHVLAGSVTIAFPENLEDKPTVTMSVVVADDLDIDLPSAVVEALAVEA